MILFICIDIMFLALLLLRYHSPLEYSNQLKNVVKIKNYLI